MSRHCHEMGLVRSTIVVIRARVRSLDQLLRLNGQIDVIPDVLNVNPGHTFTCMDVIVCADNYIEQVCFKCTCTSYHIVSLELSSIQLIMVSTYVMKGKEHGSKSSLYLTGIHLLSYRRWNRSYYLSHRQCGVDYCVRYNGGRQNFSIPSIIANSVSIPRSLSLLSISLSTFFAAAAAGTEAVSGREPSAVECITDPVEQVDVS